MKVIAHVAHSVIDDVMATANALRIRPEVVRSTLHSVKDYCDRHIRLLDRIIDPHAGEMNG